MQGKRFRDDIVEIEAFKVDKPGGKWLVFTYYHSVSYVLGQLVKRCDELPTEYPNLYTQEMVPIKWTRWTGESKAYREMHAAEFMEGLKESF